MLNTVKILTTINKIIETLPTEEQKFIDKALTEEVDYTQIIATAPAFIIELKKDCLNDIKHTSAKTNGTATALKAGERILKNMQKNGHIKGTFNYDSMQVICDGFHAVLLKEALPLKEIPDNAHKMDMKSIIDNAKNNKGEAFKIPTASEVKSYIKIYKAEHPDYKKRANKGVIYELSNGSNVNAEYLLDIAELLRDDTMMIPSSQSINKIIYCESGKGIGLLCPIYKKENQN